MRSYHTINEHSQPLLSSSSFYSLCPSLSISSFEFCALNELSKKNDNSSKAIIISTHKKSDGKHRDTKRIQSNAFSPQIYKRSSNIHRGHILKSLVKGRTFSLCEMINIISGFFLHIVVLVTITIFVVLTVLYCFLLFNSLRYMREWPSEQCSNRSYIPHAQATATTTQLLHGANSAVFIRYVCHGELRTKSTQIVVETSGKMPKIGQKTAGNIDFVVGEFATFLSSYLSLPHDSCIKSNVSNFLLTGFVLNPVSNKALKIHTE